MRRIILGQVLLILCCIFYLIWWYRGYRPGITVSRIGGVNGVLFLATAVLGIAGLLCSITKIPAQTEPTINPNLIVIGGIAAYFVLLLITRVVFQRVVTTELFLIVGWAMLEMTVINRLHAAGYVTDQGFMAMCMVIAAAFIISMVLYVAYYRMDEMKAFYAAMVPLMTEAVSMAVLTGIVLTG